MFLSLFSLQSHLRSVDVKILQQLLAVNEGIEAVKWLMEERSTLTSRCSSLTSSQYSLGDTSWRGSWSSLQDPNDKLDNISIGSYLDTLADDMDEYCPSSSESVICSSAAPLASEGAARNRTGGGAAGPGTGVRPCVGVGSQENGLSNGSEAKAARGAAPAADGASAGEPAPPVSCPQTKQDAPVWSKTPAAGKEGLASEASSQSRAAKANGLAEKAAEQTGSPTHLGLGQKQSPKLKTYRNGKIELDTCKMNGKMHLEYDAHWRWVQSQEDVTFL